MAWEGSMSPAEEPAPSDTDAKDPAAITSEEDTGSSASGDTAGSLCSGSEDGKTDEDAQETADTTDSTDQTTQNTIPRFRLPLLGRVPARYLPFWVAEFAAALTKGLTPVQMNVLGSFVATIGDAISLIASKAEVEEDEGII